LIDKAYAHKLKEVAIVRNKKLHEFQKEHHKFLNKTKHLIDIEDRYKEVDDDILLLSARKSTTDISHVIQPIYSE
jgi:hypothetical protein